MNENTSEIALAVIFAGLGIYLLYCNVKTMKYVVIKDRMWNIGRILFALCGFAAAISMVISSGAALFRLACMVFCIVMFLWNRDGIGEKGIITMGRVTPWQDLRAYDYQLKKKTFDVFFQIRVGKNERDQDILISFMPKDQETVMDFLKKTAGKKYKRMRKEER